MASRYQQRALYAERGTVKTFEGLDPLTGLPVLIYRFAGKPPRTLEHLESENIPGVLEVSRDDEGAQVVVAYSRDYRPLVHPLHVPVSVLLQDSARALRDAAQAGIVHGDLRPVRFLASRDHVLLEGFGIPWKEESADFATDIRAWARSVSELAEGVMPAAVTPLLERCLADDPRQRPDAATLYRELGKALSRSTDPSLVMDPLEPPTPADAELSAASFGDALDRLGLTETPPSPTPSSQEAKPGASRPEIPTLEQLELTLDSLPEAPTETETPPAPPLEDEEPPDVLRAWRRSEKDERDADPMIIVSDPGLLPSPDARATPSATPNIKTGAKPGPRPSAPTPPNDERAFVKTLPPGATYRSGDEEQQVYLRPGSFEEYTFGDELEDRSRKRRRLLLLVLLFVAAAVLGALALWQQRQAQPALPESQPGSFFVNVQVVPATLPPVTLYVVSSPPGSSLVPGAAISTVPGNVEFDRSGSWRVQGRYQGVASEDVSLNIPEDRSITLTMPTGGP